MKFTVNFKTPDAVEYALVNEFQYEHPDENGLVPVSKGRLNKEHAKVSDCLDLTDKFVSWGEYIAVEFDSEAGTATVIPVPKRK